MIVEHRTDQSPAPPPGIADLAALPIERSHGKLAYTRCPLCDVPLHWCWRPRDHSHENFAKCPTCRWGMWERDMDADIEHRYPAVYASRLADLEREIEWASRQRDYARRHRTGYAPYWDDQLKLARRRRQALLRRHAAAAEEAGDVPY